ncbi:hypothetical protein WMY93_016786 [Mugilogobius chulae]|uniref:Uncharacterized protein n=1 Tax=Mugilogobius chulae TaxID=88201 RepID=A0AAW0NSV4_9GOBI
MADSGEQSVDSEENAEMPIVSAPTTFKSDVWKHFGFAVSTNANGTKAKLNLKVNAVSRLLGRIRRVASFFHRSSTATAVLTTKQKLLNLPVHKLIIDVVTRWNSSLDIVERYLEQQQAVAAALLSDELRQKSRDIDTLDTSDISNAEDLVKLLTPIKKATTVLCDESQPTVSLISPLKQMIQDSMSPNANDSSAVAQMKAAILKDLSDRYQGEEEKFLLESSALDPRFRTLQHLHSSSERKEVFDRILLKALQMQQQDPSQDVLPPSPSLTDDSSECSVPPPRSMPWRIFWQPKEPLRSEIVECPANHNTARQRTSPMLLKEDRVWIVGDSYVWRGEETAAKTIGRYYGLINASLSWFGWGGLKWNRLMAFFHQCLRGRSALDDLRMSIHCGGNDLGEER